MDMSSVIVPKSDQINADDLIGGDMLITIREVKISGGQEQPVSIYFDGSDKAYRPCKSMSRVLVAAWGPDAKAYVGRSLQLYRDPTVKWGGMEVGGIRIRAMTDIQRDMTMALTATKGSRKPYTVKPLAIAAQNGGGQKADKAADGVRALIDRLNEIGPGKMAEAILSSAEVVKQREWLASKRPELAAEVDACVAALVAADDDFPEISAAAGASLSAEAEPSTDGGAAAPAKEEGTLHDRMAAVAEKHKRGTTPTLADAKSAIDALASQESATEDAVNAAFDGYRDQLSEGDYTALSGHVATVIANRWPEGGE